MDLCSRFCQTFHYYLKFIGNAKMTAPITLLDYCFIVFIHRLNHTVINWQFKCNNQWFDAYNGYTHFKGITFSVLSIFLIIDHFDKFIYVCFISFYLSTTVIEILCLKKWKREQQTIKIHANACLLWTDIYFHSRP